MSFPVLSRLKFHSLRSLVFPVPLPTSLVLSTHAHSTSRWSGYSESAATGRAQRASARNQNGATSALDPPVHSEAGISTITQPISVDSDPFTMVVDDDPPLSRANSSLNVREAISTGANTRGKRRDKGKGKEIEPSIVRVKEEPKAISLHTPEPVGSLVRSLLKLSLVVFFTL